MVDCMKDAPQQLENAFSDCIKKHNQTDNDVCWAIPELGGEAKLMPGGGHPPCVNIATAESMKKCAAQCSGKKADYAQECLDTSKRVFMELAQKCMNTSGIRIPDILSQLGNQNRPQQQQNQNGGPPNLNATEHLAEIAEKHRHTIEAIQQQMNNNNRKGPAGGPGGKGPKGNSHQKDSSHQHN